MTEVKPIQITRSIEYHPGTYLDYCKESGVAPSQDGFVEFIREYIDEDFQSTYYKQIITEL